MAGLRCVGIDVSANELTVALEGRAEPVSLANDEEGHARLLRLLARRGRRVRVCLEATGIYHLDLALALGLATPANAQFANTTAGTISTTVNGGSGSTVVPNAVFRSESLIQPSV